MPMLWLTEADVARLLDLRQAIDLVEAAFAQLAAGRAMNVPRFRATAPGSVLHCLSASAEYLGLSGYKAYTTTRQGARFHLVLFDLASGAAVAWIEAGLLGQLRTAATTAVAADYMAAPDATEIGLFGTGYQAQGQLRALALVRPLQRAFVYGRDEQRRVDFAERMQEQLGLSVIPVDRPQEAAEELPIVVTATTSPAPVFDGNCLAEGALVCAVGSNWPNRAEIDSDVIRRADHIVCDSVAACRAEAGDFADALEKGIFDWSRAVDLAQVVTGRAVGRGKAHSISLFKSVGMALEDLALGARLLELARQQGAGQELPLG